MSEPSPVAAELAALLAPKTCRLEQALASLPADIRAGYQAEVAGKRFSPEIIREGLGQAEHRHRRIHDP